MRRGFLVLGGLVSLFVVALSTGAMEFSGTVEVSADLLPALGADADFGIVIAGETWSISSNTTFDLAPTFAADEEIALSYDADILRFAANASFALAPDPSARGGASITIDLLDTTIREADPAVSLSADGTIGATIDEIVDPYATISTRLGIGSHWVSNTTSFGFTPFDVTSSLLAYVLLGSFSVAEDAVSVTLSGSASIGLVPLAFSYARFDAPIGIGDISILNSVTYMGEMSFLASSKVTVAIAQMTLAVWGSYTSTGDDPFAVGVTLGTSWGPL